MAFEDGVWIMRGLPRNDPGRVRSYKQLTDYVEEVGFLPLFANGIKGFSAEEHCSADYWWTGIREEDPWEWREIIAAEKRVAYGKFFDKKAGFISLSWLPYFVNYRRDGYDFDSRWEDGLADRREKKIMDLLTERDKDGDTVYSDIRILSTELKKTAGFGKGNDKNFPGIMTGLQMQTYLVITGFRCRENKRGAQFGMPVSIPQPPEAVWGYEAVTAAYNETPNESRARIVSRVKELFPSADDALITKLIGKKR